MFFSLSQLTASAAEEQLAGNPGFEISGNTLTVKNPQMADRGVYICSVAGGQARSSGILEIERREPPVLEIYPQPEQRVTEGQGVFYQCRVTGGIPTPTMQWSRTDGRPISSNVEILDGGVLRINSASAAEAGEYKCTATNAAGTEEMIATLVLQSLPRVTIQPASMTQIPMGQPISLRCTASGTPLPSVTWARAEPGSAPIRATTEPPRGDSVAAVYDVPRASMADQGTYICRAQSESGTTEEIVQVIVTEGAGASSRPDYNQPNSGPDYNQPGYPGYPQPNYPGYPTSRPNYNPAPRPDQSGGVQVADQEFQAPLGGNAELKCFLVGNMQNVRVQWVRQDGQRLPQGSYERGGILYLRDIMRDNSGAYSCQGVDPSGRVIFSATTNLVVTGTRFGNVTLKAARFLTGLPVFQPLQGSFSTPPSRLSDPATTPRSPARPPGTPPSTLSGRRSAATCPSTSASSGASCSSAGSP